MYYGRWPDYLCINKASLYIYLPHNIEHLTFPVVYKNIINHVIWAEFLHWLSDSTISDYVAL